MTYERFKNEIARILKAKDRPVPWTEIRASSRTLTQRAPYHVYVQKLQGDIGLVRFKSGGRTLWALRSWFESGKFDELLPAKLQLIVLHRDKEQAIVADEYHQLKRIYPLHAQFERWDVIEVEVEEFFPIDDRRPESVKIRGETRLRMIEGIEEQRRAVERVAESGEFLHTGTGRGKTLGLTKPRFRCFYFYDSKCQFFCDQSVCVGHDMDVEADTGIRGDRIYFILEARERVNNWTGIEWYIKSVIALNDPGQSRLFM